MHASVAEESPWLIDARGFCAIRCTRMAAGSQLGSADDNALVLLGGFAMRQAVATSLVIVALNSAVGFLKYLDVLENLNGTVDWHTIGLFVIVGAAGSFVGKLLNTRMNQAALQRGFAVFLILMAGFILVRESIQVIAPPAPQLSAQSHP